MESIHKRYISFDQGVVSAIINFAINFAIGYFVALSVMPLWGWPGIVADSMIMIFLLTFLTCLVITWTTYQKIKQKKITALTRRSVSHPVLRHLPANLWIRSLVLGVIYLLVLTPVLILVLTALNVDSMTFWQFVIFKGSFAGINALLVGPLSAFIALGDG
ncbi:MAG TPA: hypothetical protein VLM75_06565 [Spirochaetota bacterium]|nr:hypothetical protein [Spirochaetota bacterium]